MPNKNVEYLRENGPATNEELPNYSVSISDREKGVWNINPTGSSAGSSTNGKLTPVYYLKGEHEPIEIIEKWYQVHEEQLEGVSPITIRERLQSQGKEFHDAVKEVVPLHA